MPCPVSVVLTLRPSSIVIEVEASDAQRGKLKGDSDNFAKSCLDALVRGGVLEDDSQVVELSVRMEGGA